MQRTLKHMVAAALLGLALALGAVGAGHLAQPAMMQVADPAAAPGRAGECKCSPRRLTPAPSPDGEGAISLPSVL